MTLRGWWAERKARKETKRRLTSVVTVSQAVKAAEPPRLAPMDEKPSATAAFALVARTVEDATEAKRSARGAAQRILAMFEKSKK